MQYLASGAKPSLQNSQCVVVGIYSKRTLNSAALDIDKASKSALKKLASSGDLPADLGKTTLLRGLPGVKSPRILVVGLGAQKKFCTPQLEKATEAAVTAIGNTGAKNATFYLASDTKTLNDPERTTRATIMAAKRVLYRFDELKSKSTPSSKLQKIGVGFEDRKAVAKAKKTFASAEATANGVNLARTLGNLPPNICTPEYLAKTARKLASGNKNLTVDVKGMPEIKKLKMGAFISVTQGAKRPPRLITLKYSGAPKSQAPIVLVGKGITFDTGGISLKPPPGMDEMKFDMCGAASVLGVFAAISEMKLNANVIGIIPACENMPSSTATRPGDIVTTMSGKTVEILNTDAEGRLILCDALTYSQKFKAKTTIDVATLTGACVIALGDIHSGLMSPDDGLANDLLNAGLKAGDTAWRMPVQDEYFPKLKSNFADFSNVGGRPAGAVTAATYLWQFMQDKRWAHLDIAGTAWHGGARKGATGRPVALLVQYLMDQA